MAAMQEGLRSTLMASLYGAGGAFFTFRPVFLATVVNPEQVGSILLLGSILTTFTNPIISAIADSLKAQRALMLLSTGGQALCQLAMLSPGLGYRGLLILVSLHKLIGEHAFPIMDASTVSACGDRYGPIRLWGAIGFGAAALGGGSLISMSGSPNARSNFVTAFGFASAMQLISLPMVLKLDFSSLQGGGSAAAKDPSAPTGVAALAKVVSSAKMLFFTVIVFLSGCSGSLIDTFLNVHLGSMGASGLLMGVARMLTCAAEVPFFRVSGKVLDVLGVSGSIASAQVAYLLRFLWYINLRSISKLGPWGLWAILPVELLHGLTFAVNWSAITTHCVRVAPPGMVGTTQQLISTVHWGLAQGVGAAVGGRVLARTSGERMYQMGALIAAVTLALTGVGSSLFGKELLGRGVVPQAKAVTP